MLAREISCSELRVRRYCESLTVAFHALEKGSEDLQASQLSFSSQVTTMSLMTSRKLALVDHGASMTRPLERSIN